MLELRSLRKVFYEDRRNRSNPLLVFSDVTFTVPKNHFVCLLGPSGCGKTTLIRIIAGLISPDGGEVLVEGKRVTAPGMDRSMVFQNYGLLPWRTVMGNVELGLEIRNMGTAERRAVCQRYIEKVGLRGFEDRYPHQLSGGMQQRVALARALSKDPKILLMDEPFASVDMQTRETLQEELLKIWSTTDTTVLFITHSIEEAIYLGDRVLVMGPRPSQMRRDVPIDLPRPRYTYDAKSSPRFGELRAIVRDAMREGQLSALG